MWGLSTPFGLVGRVVGRVAVVNPLLWLIAQVLDCRATDWREQVNHWVVANGLIFNPATKPLESSTGFAIGKFLAVDVVLVVERIMF